jgi:hypothetical protein
MKYLLPFSIALILFVSCDDEKVEPVVSKSFTIKNLPADPGTGRDSVGNLIGDKKLFTFFRLSDSTVVSNSDSATTKWDIGFKGSTIILNGGTSGPGQTAGFFFNGIYNDLKEVPLDSIFKKDSAPNYVVNKSWYAYNPAAMTIAPVPGRFIVLKTTLGHYAKLEILSYYKNAPTSPNAFIDADRYYTFRYFYQGNGTTKFE